MSGNVTIRPLRDQDAQIMNRYWNDVDVRKSLREGPRFRTLDDARVYIHFSRGRGENGRDFAIDVDGSFAGCISWEYLNGVFLGSAEISYWVGKPFRGRHIASIAITQASEFLFNKRRLRRVFAKVGSNNIASVKALERAGYKKEAVLKEALWVNDEPLDCLIFSALAHEWNAKNHV